MAREINGQTLQDIVKLSRAAQVCCAGRSTVSEHLAWIDRLEPLVEAAWTSDAPAACRGWIAEIDYTSAAILMRLRELADRPDHKLDLTREKIHIRDCALRMSARALEHMAGI